MKDYKGRGAGQEECEEEMEEQLCGCCFFFAGNDVVGRFFNPPRTVDTQH